MISSSIYHIVEDPSKNDIEFIIKILFKEAELDAQNISDNAINEPKITLNEIQK